MALGFIDSNWAYAGQMVEPGIIRAMAQSDITNYGAGGVQYSANDSHADQSFGVRLAGTWFDPGRHWLGNICKTTSTQSSLLCRVTVPI